MQFHVDYNADKLCLIFYQSPLSRDPEFMSLSLSDLLSPGIAAI